MNLNKVMVLAGIVILLIGGYFVYSPSTFGYVASVSGITSSKVTYDQSVALNVKSSNYAFVNITLTPRDNLSAKFEANTPGVNFLLMDSGNFSDFKSGSSSQYYVLPESALNVQNYTFDFSPTAPSQVYYLVFTPAATNASTTVLVHLTVLTNNSVSGSEFVPILLIVLGLALLGVGMNVGKKKKQEKKVKETAPVVIPARATPAACRFCNATLNPDSPYCPSCGKAQF